MAVCLALITVCCGAGTKAIPFGPSEQLLFSLESRGVGIGQAIFVAERLEPQGEATYYRFSAIIDLSFLASQFYSGPESVCAIVDEALSQTVHYEKERKDDQVMQASFDADEQTLVASIDGELNELVLEQDVLDPLSLLYIVRLQDLKDGHDLTFTVSDGRQVYRVQAKKVRKVSIEWQGKPTAAWYLKPDLGTLEGIFESEPLPGVTEIWLTADERRLPIRMVSQDADGTVISVLEEVVNTPDVSVEGCAKP